MSSQKKVTVHKLEVAVLEEKCQPKHVFVNQNLWMEGNLKLQINFTVPLIIIFNYITNYLCTLAVLGWMIISPFLIKIPRISALIYSARTGSICSTFSWRNNNSYFRSTSSNIIGIDIFNTLSHWAKPILSKLHIFPWLAQQGAYQFVGKVFMQLPSFIQSERSSHCFGNSTKSQRFSLHLKKTINILNFNKCCKKSFLTEKN